MTPKLIKTIRTYLGLNQDELAESIGVSKPTLVRIEDGGTLKEEYRLALLDFFTENKIVVSPSGKGFEEADQTVQKLSGRKGFHTIYKQMYRAIRQGSPDLWLYNGVSHLVADGLGEEFIKEHQPVMQSLEGKFNWRVIVEEGDDAFWGHRYAYYRWIPKKYFNNKTIYVYGDSIALVDFEGEITIDVIHSKDYANTQRLFLQNTWETTAYDPDSEKPFRPE